MSFLPAIGGIMSKALPIVGKVAKHLPGVLSGIGGLISGIKGGGSGGQQQQQQPAFPSFGGIGGAARDFIGGGKEMIDRFRRRDFGGAIGMLPNMFDRGRNLVGEGRRFVGDVGRWGRGVRNGFRGGGNFQPGMGENSLWIMPYRRGGY